MDSDPPSDSPVDQSRFDLVVRTRSWEWLDALSRRLHLDVQFVDAQGRSRMPAHAPANTPLAQLVAVAAPELRLLVNATILVQTRQDATVQGLPISAYPLSDRGEVVGAVLVANTTPPRDGSAVDEPIDRDVAVQSVLHAIDAYVQVPPISARPLPDDIASLGRVLDTTASQRSDRELVSAFAAALAFWKQVEVYGYVMTATGTFAADVAPPAPRQPKMPSSIPMAVLPSASALTPLSPPQIAASGITHGPNVFVARIPDGDFPWLIVCCGAISRPEAQRLAMYVRLLDQMMRTMIADATITLINALSAHLLEQRDAVGEAAGAVLDALMASTGMASSALKITTGFGAPLLQVGQVEQLSGEPTGARLISVRRVPNRYALTLVLTSNEGRRITRQQRDIVEAAANLLDAWVRGVLVRLPQRDRRSSSKTFDEVLDRFAGHALEHGSTVSVIVMLMTEAASVPGLTQQWITRIRAAMRGSDIVGMLGEGEVALLLHDTGRDRADAVAQRVVKMLDTSQYPSPVVATGIASRAPGGAGGAGLLAEARSDAMLRATASLIHEPRTQGTDDKKQPP
jgi:hypothetical protein